jgi:hypothetical protein
MRILATKPRRYTRPMLVRVELPAAMYALG